MIPFLAGALIAGWQPSLDIACVDPLEKVFSDSRPQDLVKMGVVDVARGETASWQIVVRSPSAISDFRCTASSLRGVAPLRIRYVRRVPIDRPTIPDRDPDALRPVPTDYPDPLMPVVPGNLQPETTEALWIDVQVPARLTLGEYAATVRVSGRAGGKVIVAEVPLRMRVHPVTLGSQRFAMTTWFRPYHSSTPPAAGTPTADRQLARIAQNMAEHRQNVSLVSALGLATLRADNTFDFQAFDRTVNILRRYGAADRIEGGHLGGRAGGWSSPFVVTVREFGKPDRSVPPESPEADAFYSRFLPELVRHLKEKGWLGVYRQHLADEPIRSNTSSYRAIAALLRKHAPELKTIEATHTKELVGSVDTWVPELDYFDRDVAFYRERQRAGDELWFYTCVFPQSRYLNRFIEQPLIKTRLLPWLAFRYGATGYLHWGYNQWRDDPYSKLTPAHGGPEYLPAGDAWIVYPGEDGPVDSIRWEQMRDGVADYELLAMLGDRNPARARLLASELVRGFTDYSLDIARFRSVKRRLLEAIEGMD